MGMDIAHVGRSAPGTQSSGTPDNCFNFSRTLFKGQQRWDSSAGTSDELPSALTDLTDPHLTQRRPRRPPCPIGPPHGTKRPRTHLPYL